MFLYSDDPKASILLAEVLVPAGIAPRAVHAIPLTEAIVELVRAGGGISVLASRGVAPYLADESLVALPLGKRGFRRAWSAVALKDSAAEQHLSGLVEELRKAGLGIRPKASSVSRCRRRRTSRPADA